MNRAQYLACKKQIETVATLVRELPLEEFVAEAEEEDRAAKALAVLLLEVKRAQPAVPANVFRGKR